MPTKKPAKRVAKPGAGPPSASNPERTVGKTTRRGRTRMNLLVDPALLRRAEAVLGTSNKSEAVNVALQRLSEEAEIHASLAAAAGAIPDFPDSET